MKGAKPSAKAKAAASVAAQDALVAIAGGEMDAEAVQSKAAAAPATSGRKQVVLKCPICKETSQDLGGPSFCRAAILF